jgi:hypothetical protein
VKKILLTLFLMLTTATLNSADFQIQRYYDFSGGLNTTQTNTMIADNEASAIQNISFDEPGAIKKRSGYTVSPTTYTVVNSAEIKGLYDYIKQDSNQYFIAATSSTINKYVAAATAWSVLCSTATLTDGQYYDFTVFNDTMVITAPGDIPKKWYGTLTATENIGTGTDPDDWRPNTAAYCETYDYRLWFGNITDANGGVTDSVKPNRLRYSSDLGTVAFEGADAYPPLQYFDMDDSAITGLAVVASRLMVFCPNKIYAISGQSDTTRISYYRIPISDGVGCPSNRSIVNVDNMLYFMGRDGHFYKTDGYNVQRISDKINGTIAGLNKAQLGRVCATYYPKMGQIWWSVPTGSSTYNDNIIIYYPKLNAWSVYDGINAGSITTRKVSGDYKLYTGDSAAGFVYLQDSGNSDYDASTTTAKAIDSYFTTKSFGLGYPEYLKKWDSAYINTNHQGVWSVDVEFALDFGKSLYYTNINLNPNTAIWGTFVWGDGSLWSATTSISIDELPIERDGQFLRLKFANDSAGQPFTIYGFTLKYSPYPLY